MSVLHTHPVERERERERERQTDRQTERDRERERERECKINKTNYFTNSDFTLVLHNSYIPRLAR